MSYDLGRAAGKAAEPEIDAAGPFDLFARLDIRFAVFIRHGIYLDESYRRGVLCRDARRPANFRKKATGTPGIQQERRSMLRLYIKRDGRAFGQEGVQRVQPERLRLKDPPEVARHLQGQLFE